MTDPEKPTPESIEAAQAQRALPAPPVQIDEAQMSRMTPEQVDAAFERQELHLVLGGKLDADGWPVNASGRRISPRGSR